MKKLLTVVAMLLISCLSYSQETIFVKDPSSKLLKAYNDSLNIYNSFVKEKNRLSNKYRYQYEERSFTGKLKGYKFGNVEEESCICGSNNDDEFVFLDNKSNYKPTKVVKLIPNPQTAIKHDTIMVYNTAVKWKTVIKRDTIIQPIVIRDTIQLACKENLDPSVLVKHTSIDKQTKLDYSTEPVTPFVEKRLYDYNGKYMGTVRVNPLTHEPLE
jgi:hypothetical protein